MAVAVTEAQTQLTANRSAELLLPRFNLVRPSRYPNLVPRSRHELLTEKPWNVVPVVLTQDVAERRRCQLHSSFVLDLIQNRKDYARESVSVNGRTLEGESPGSCERQHVPTTTIASWRIASLGIACAFRRRPVALLQRMPLCWLTLSAAPSLGR